MNSNVNVNKNDKKTIVSDTSKVIYEIKSLFKSMK